MKAAMVRQSVLALALVLSACGMGDPAVPDDRTGWPSYGRDYTEQRFSPADEITMRSVARLGLFKVLDLPDETGLVATPLMVGRTLYFPGKFSKVYAVDAVDGTIKWTFDPDVRARLMQDSRRMKFSYGTSRGVAYWKGRIFVGTGDGRLIALSAKDGREIWSVQTFDPATPRYITGAPLAFNGKILIGHGGADLGPVRGYVTAYDAATGKQAWRFYTVPGNPADGFENKAMEMAAKTWTGEWWKYGGGGTVWNSMTYDPEFNRVYLGTGNGAPWNRDIRSPGGGDNLFLASVVALNADTGEYAWHYQENPGETWDYNSNMDMVLADLIIDGRPRKVLMHAPKNGFFYVIDRQNGKLISAEKFAKVTWASHVDLKTGRPVELPGARPGKGVSSIWPGGFGAHSWPSMSFNPDTQLVYLPMVDLPGNYDARGVDPATWKVAPFEYWHGYSDLFGRNVRKTPAETAEIARDAGAWLQARDPRTNKIVWRVRQPGLYVGGTLTTAGGLVFTGQASGDFVAYDARTGAKLWSFDAQRPITAPPITYVIEGRQYVAVLVGAGGSVGAEGSTADAKRRMGYRDGGRRLLIFRIDAKENLPPEPRESLTPIDVPGLSIDAGKVLRGRAIFDAQCFTCHGSNAISGGGAPDLRSSPVATDLATMRQIVLGGALEARGMPKFTELTSGDVEALYHYIRAQARADATASPAPSANAP